MSDSWLESASNWINNAIRPASTHLAGVRETVGRWISNITNHRIPTDRTIEAIPYIAAGAVGVGTLLFNEPLGKLGKWLFKGVKKIVTGFGYFEQIPLIGGVFSKLGHMTDTAGGYSAYLIGGVASLLTFKLFNLTRLPLGSVAESIPVGQGTIPPRTSEQMLEQTPVPVPQNNAPGNPLPPVTHNIPVARPAGPDTPGVSPPPDPTDPNITLNWERVMALQVQADGHSNAVGIGIGTVQAASLSQLFGHSGYNIQEARQRVGTLRISYQSWQESIRMLREYTRDYREQVVPQIRRQLETLGITDSAELDALIPHFPPPPTLYPGTGDEWSGINDVSSDLNKYGHRAAAWMMRQHRGDCQGLTANMTAESYWNGMNVSERINFLEGYCARVHTAAHTGPDGERRTEISFALSGSWNPFSVLGVGDYADWCSRISTMAADCLAKRNNGTITSADYVAMADLWQEGLDNDYFSDAPGNRNTVRLMVEYNRSKPVLDELRRFDREVHEPNRRAMEEYAAPNGPLLGAYNRSVHVFRQRMQELEATRCMVVNPSVAQAQPLEIREPCSDQQYQPNSFRYVEVRDCRRSRANRFVQFYVEEHGDVHVIRAMRVKNGNEWGEWSALSEDVPADPNALHRAAANIMNRIDAGTLILNTGLMRVDHTSAATPVTAPPANTPASANPPTTQNTPINPVGSALTQALPLQARQNILCTLATALCSADNYNEPPGVRLNGMRMLSHETHYTDSVPHIRHENMSYPQGYQPNGDFLLVMDHRNNQQYFIEGEWRMGNAPERPDFIAKRIVAANDPQHPITLAQETTIASIGNNTTAQLLRSIITQATPSSDKNIPAPWANELMTTPPSPAPALPESILSQLNGLLSGQGLVMSDANNIIPSLIPRAVSGVVNFATQQLAAMAA